MPTTSKDDPAHETSGEQQLNTSARDELQMLILPLTAIEPDPDQPRQDQGTIVDLAESIQKHGVLQPIIVEETSRDRYRIIAGQRRFSACQKLRMETIPCVVRTVAPKSRLVLQLIENIQRKDLHPLEEARALKRLMDEGKLSQDKVARQIGRSKSAVSQSLRLLNIPPEVLSSVEASASINKSVLLEIAKESDPDRQKNMCRDAQAGELTVRKARAKKASVGKLRPKITVIAVPDATVQVLFRAGKATTERIIEALKAALEKESSLLKRRHRQRITRSQPSGEREENLGENNRDCPPVDCSEHVPHSSAVDLTPDGEIGSPTTLFRRLNNDSFGLEFDAERSPENPS